MNTIQGLVLLDVDVAALNNAGNDPNTTLENAVATKMIDKGGRKYPYVSGQAWRYWWRETLLREFGWDMSPIIREKKIAFTSADPVAYADDDIFGYMRAAKVKKKNITLTRVSPLKNSALIAAAFTRPAQHWSSMSRHDGDQVPYGKDEYCAVLKGQFSLDLDQAGTFSSRARTGFQNMDDNMRAAALENGANEVDDPFLKDEKGEPLKLVRLGNDIRQKRVTDTISALKFLSGGAKQSTNLADVTPKMILLARFKSGNHPFSHIVKENDTLRGQAVFSVPALEEILSDFKDQFASKVYIGRRTGFMDSLDEVLAKLAKENPMVAYGSVNAMIDAFTADIELE